MPQRQSRRNRLLRRTAYTCVAIVAAGGLAAVAYEWVAAVPTRDLKVAAPGLFFIGIARPEVPIDAKLLCGARHAQFDHFMHPLPELRDYRFIHFLGAFRFANQLFLGFAPNTTDAYVVYECTADGKLLWRGYFDDSP